MTTDIERGGIDVGSHEPSYYEIALTNRQVVVAFAILLICVVAAFLSGVWLGRESAVRAQEKLALLTRGAAAGAATGNGDGLTTDLTKPEGQALQEFKFFADSRHRSTEAGAGNAPRPAGAPPAAADSNNAPDAGDNADTPPAAKETPPGAAAFGDGAAAGKGTAGARGKNPPPPTGGKAAPAGKAAATSEAPAAGTAATAARSGRKAAADAHAAPPAAAEAQASAPSGTAGTPANSDVVKPRALPEGGAKSAAAAAAAAGEVVIQVFSSADKEQADRVKDGLAQSGLPAFLSPITKDGQTMYRVRIGPYPNRAAAEPVAEKVRKEQKLDTWITPK